MFLVQNTQVPLAKQQRAEDHTGRAELELCELISMAIPMSRPYPSVKHTGTGQLGASTATEPPERKSVQILTVQKTKKCV